MLVSRKSLFMSLVSILSFQAIQAQAEDWPTFRGTGRTAVSAESGLLDSWPSEGPKLLWTAKGAGNGYASPAVVAGRIYTLGDHDNGQLL